MRIPVDLNNDDKVIRVNLEQEFDSIEILSLKITNSDAYSRVCSDYGVVVGRVMLNSGFGVQNAKVSIFVPITQDDLNRDEITQLYPFQTVNDTYPNGVRYNLFPRVRNNNPSHRSIGNFPTESDFTHYPQYVEIMEKYYKYTTITNESGDYMIFGVPVGNQNIVMDFDVFDTPSFELTANDLVEQVSSLEVIKALETATGIDTEVTNKIPGFIYKGNNNFEVEVKTNIDEMPNIFHQVKQITVSPFWGDNDVCDVGISRCDFKINFKYTPSAIFFGYVHAPSGAFTIEPSYKYSSAFKEPNNKYEIPGYDTTNNFSGNIYPYQEMEIVVYRIDDVNKPIKKRVGVYTGSKFNGVFRIALPMYSDFYVTNEYGDLVKTDDTTLGIPTKGYYAFEIYDTNEGWNGRRKAWGYFNQEIVPGIRIPASNTGDPELGGWHQDGALFEYDIINRKRKFYTVIVEHNKHDIDDVLTDGDYVGYLPKFNAAKSANYWNFPLTDENVINYDIPTIIGSVLVPRFSIWGDDGSKSKNNPSSGDMSFTSNGSLYSPNRLLVEPDDQYFTKIYNHDLLDCEKYFGIGVQTKNGLNMGETFINSFSVDDFLFNEGTSSFGEINTWNYGDNSTITFTPTLYAVAISQLKDSNANGLKVQKPYTQVISPYNTFGVFLNCCEQNGKIPLLTIGVYDISDDITSLIKDRVYSSYSKGMLLDKRITPTNLFEQIDETEIYVEEDGVTFNQSGSTITTYDNNTYNGRFYFFGVWKDANSLYDIETNYTL
jgi:hypothetical protein